MITLDGKHINEFGLYVRPGEDIAILPTTRDSILTVPGKHGAYDFGAYMEALEIVLPLGFDKTENRAKLQNKIRHFAAFLTDKYGRPRTFELRVNSEPEKWYNVRYTGSLKVERLLTLGFFDLPVTAFDPYAYADNRAYEEPYTFDESVNYDDEGVIFVNPSGFNWTSLRHMSSIYNYSPYVTQLSLRIYGNVKDGKITNLTTGESMELPELNGDVLDINGLTYMVTKNGDNALNDVNGKFITLESGKNDLIFEGETVDATVEFTWLHRFL